MIKNKKGLSGVITAVLMIALAMAAVIIVWNVVNNLVSEKLEETSSCFDVFGKITINNRYTCYDDTNKGFQFSLNMGDLDVDEVLVSISGAGTTNSYSLSNTATAIAGLSPGLIGSGEGNVKLPSKNGGLTYNANMSVKPDSVQIAPKISGKQCEVSDTLNQIDSCSALA